MKWTIGRISGPTKDNKWRTDILYVKNNDKRLCEVTVYETSNPYSNVPSSLLILLHDCK